MNDKSDELAAASDEKLHKHEADLAKRHEELTKAGGPASGERAADLAQNAADEADAEIEEMKRDAERRA